MRLSDQLLSFRLRAVLVCALVVFGLGCGAEEDGQDSGESRAKLTESGAFYVAYTPSPDPIPFNQLFELDVEVWESADMANAVADADVSVEVTMPAHGHGMNTEPTVTNNDDGTYLVEGMKFHMESQSPAERWEIAVSVDRDGTADTAVFEVMCCGQ
ncbi:FixH family protein [Persicimonas caeni]|uniref:FixH family protein n=1 Tax=Persicimonas caeni TaxID=2292766 RepID=UPI00143D6A72|nr:FixH family protein [Persicimonas caeni]